MTALYLSYLTSVKVHGLSFESRFWSTPRWPKDFCVKFSGFVTLIFIYFLHKELHEIHSGLLRQLKLATDACMPGSGAPRLADVFLAWRERLLLYGDYCSNLTNAQETLKMLDAKDPIFNKQLAVSTK